MNREENSTSNQISLTEIVQSAQKNVFEGIILTKGHWDQSRNFKIFEHVFTGNQFENLSQEYNVTLVTQSSFDRLYSLTEVTLFVECT